MTNGSPAASVGKPRDHGQDTLPPTEAQLKARAFVDAVIADGAVREGVVVKTDQVQWSARLLVLSQFTGRSYSKSERLRNLADVAREWIELAIRIPAQSAFIPLLFSAVENVSPYNSG